MFFLFQVSIALATQKCLITRILLIKVSQLFFELKISQSQTSLFKSQPDSLRAIQKQRHFISCALVISNNYDLSLEAILLAQCVTGLVSLARARALVCAGSSWECVIDGKDTGSTRGRETLSAYKAPDARTTFCKSTAKHARARIRVPYALVCVCVRRRQGR